MCYVSLQTLIYKIIVYGLYTCIQATEYLAKTACINQVSILNNLLLAYGYIQYPELKVAKHHMLAEPSYLSL